MLVLQQSAFPKSLFSPFQLKLDLLSLKKKEREREKLISLTFFDDRLICHNNVVVYMLKDKRLDYHMQLEGKTY